MDVIGKCTRPVGFAFEVVGAQHAVPCAHAWLGCAICASCKPRGRGLLARRDHTVAFEVNRAEGVQMRVTYATRLGHFKKGSLLLVPIGIDRGETGPLLREIFEREYRSHRANRNARAAVYALIGINKELFL